MKFSKKEKYILSQSLTRYQLHQQMLVTRKLLSMFAQIVGLPMLIKVIVQNQHLIVQKEKGCILQR